MGRKKKVVDNTLNKSIPLANEFDILASDVIQRENFGGFELVKTKKGIMFKNYTGYHIWISKYSAASVGLDGKAHEFCLYLAMDELFSLKKKAEQDPNGIIVDGVTNEAFYNSKAIVLESNLLRPLVVFTDEMESLKSAKEYLAWMDKKQKELAKSMSNLKEEDDKANAEFEAKQDNMEVVKTLMDADKK